jgi:hypothetical protein
MNLTALSEVYRKENMDKQEINKLVDKKVREVAQVFSQNSTALAREFTLTGAIREIVEAMESIHQVKEEKNDKPATRKTNI